MTDTINIYRHAIIDKTGAVINCIMGPIDYKCPYGDTAIHDPSNTVEIGWTTSDGGKTFTAPAPSKADLLAALDRAQAALLKQLWSFNLGSEAAPIVATTRLDPAGQTSMHHLLWWGQQNDFTQATQPYANVDYSIIPLTGAHARYLGMKAIGVVSQTYQVYGAAVAKITAGTVTTLQEVAALGWPDSTVVR